MKVSLLIKKLQKMQKQEGDVDVVIDQDENGFYDLEAVELKHDRELDEMFINIKSSSEV